jgi:hypothetical protein
MDINQSVCLNMIVKNESHIIEKTLENLCSYIKFSYFVICDTGSVDNTIDIVIDFFNKKKIKGEIYNHEWKNFGYNRTLALQAAFNKTDYLLIFDADDCIIGNLNIPVLTGDMYNLFLGTTEFKYVRPLIINNRKRWKFKGILHEYLSALEDVTGGITIEGEYFILSGREGNRSKNSNKYLKDAILLKTEIDLIESSNKKREDSDLLARYTFYCANSFKDCGDIHNAILYYKKLMDHDTWIQEKYVSALNTGDLYEKLNMMEDALIYWYKAITYDKERRESVSKIMNYYYNSKNWFALNCLHENIKDFEIKDMSTKLFLTVSNIHENHYLNSIACANISEWMSGYYSCKYLILKDVHIEITLHNFQCYAYNIHLDPDNRAFLDKLLNLFKLYYSSKKEIILNLWKIMSNYIKKIYKLDNISELIENEKSTMKIRHKIKLEEASDKILIYTGYMESLWNSSTLNSKSLGGSEKAVIYLSKSLPKNYKIYIAGDQLEEEIDNIEYVNRENLQELLYTTKFHTIIISRYVSFFVKFKDYKCYQLVLYPHDTMFLSYPLKLEDNILEEYIEITDYIMCLTEWHKSILIHHHNIIKNTNFKIINNGINLPDFETDELNKIIKIKNKFIWSSCSERGLDIILKMWPEILEEIPDATLDICSYKVFPANDTDLDMKKIIDKFDSIVHHGQLNTAQLYKLMKTSEYWLYTNTFPETSCITAMEMLMNNVICLYYPNAGLVETIGDYGVQVKKGTEIDTLLSLFEERKNILRKNGKEYAITCSWKNRAKTWSSLLGLNENEHENENENINIDINKKIAIFSSLDFHYEMFGYIIHYSKIHNYKLTIFAFTDTNFDFGWLEFYKDKFENKIYNFEIKKIDEFEKSKHLFDLVFITTDDDLKFKEAWITSKCISINHSEKIRRLGFTNNLKIRPFLTGNQIYAIPCYTIFDVDGKKNEIKKNADINVCCVGGTRNYNYNIINRLSSTQKINLYIICRVRLFKKEYVKNSNITIFELISSHTPVMLDAIKNCDYMLTDITENIDHINGYSMSGCIPLSFSTLTPLIISNKNNEMYKFENVVEFNIDTDELIFIEKDNININFLEKERQKLISMFHEYSNNILWSNCKCKCTCNTALIVDPRNNNYLPSLINDFREKLGDNWKIVFYCGKGLKNEMTKHLYNDIEIRELDVYNFRITEYSDFMKTSELWENLYGDFVLTFQADTYILNKPPYNIDFFMNMNKSYIGGNMDHGWEELQRENIYPDYRNFNGGLSLRKRLDMINIIKTFGTVKSVENSKDFLTDPEDVYFTIGCYRLNFPIGDNEECRYFSVNRILVDKWFGLHKPPEWVMEQLEEKNIFCKETNTFMIKPQIIHN